MKAKSIGSEPTLRARQAEDMAFEQALYAATVVPELAALGPEFLAQQLAARERDYSARPEVSFEIVQVDGEPVGHLYTQRLDAEHRLVDVTLLPEWRGRGVGSALVEGLKAGARAAGVPLHLSVRSDSRARALYLRQGFQVVGAEDRYEHMTWDPADATNPEPAAAPAPVNEAPDSPLLTALLGCVGDTFSVVGKLSRPVMLRLESVKRLPWIAQTADIPPMCRFSATFRGPREPLLGQQTLTLEHSRLGREAYFIIPRAQDAESTEYEIIVG